MSRGDLATVSTINTMKQMTTKVETITPQIAIEILDKHNPRNRLVSDGTVNAYANDMRNNRWTLTHQGLAFDENGDLIDGQHRLWAVIFAEKAVEFNVTRGIPVKQMKGGIEINSMDNIDNGRARSTGSQMTLCHGIKNGNSMAGACRAIAQIINPVHGKVRQSMANSMFIYEQYGRDIEAVFGALDGPKQRAYLLAPLALYHHGEPEKCLEFCRQMVTLERLSVPAKILIKWLESKHDSKRCDSTMRMVGKCIHAFHEGVTTGQRFTDDDTGLKFLLSFYPSLNKRILDAIAPIKRLRVPRSKGRSRL